MIQPQAWKVFGSHIHQDFLLEYPQFFEGLSMVYRCLKEPEQRALLAYLTQLTNESIDPSVKAKAWAESGSEILIAVSQVDEFLLQVLAALQAAEHERAGGSPGAPLRRPSQKG